MKIIFISLLAIFLGMMNFAIVEIHANEIEIILGPGVGEFGCQEKATGCISPKTINTHVGTDLTFINNDSENHYFVSGNIVDGLSNIFRTGLIYPETNFVWNVDTAGDISYFCLIHPWMSGNIVSSEVAPEPIAEQTELVIDPEPIELDFEPEPIAEQTQLVIDPEPESSKTVCGKGTYEKDGICKIIKSDEPQFCFLFWCW